MTQEQISKRAIAVLEGLALLWENGPKTLQRAEPMMDAVYRYSHIARGDCKNPHADWLIEMNQVYESFIKGGLITRCDDGNRTETENH
jgi:hypothetical protein